MAITTSRSRHIIIWFVLLTLLWWVLSGDNPSSWLIGLPVIIAALSIRSVLKSPFLMLPSLGGLLRFLPFFLVLSLRGGVDVARRAFSLALPLSPGCFEYTVRLPNESATVFFANCISLLPGTLSVDFTKDNIYVHTLDISRPVEDLKELESRIAHLFALNLRQKGNDESVTA